MFSRMKGTKRFRLMILRFSFLAALIFVAVLVACGGEASTDTPAPEATAVSAISAPTEAPPTLAPATESETVTPAPTPAQEPTAKAVLNMVAPPTVAQTKAPVTATIPPPPTLNPTQAPTAAIDAAKLIAIAEASDEVYGLLEELIAELGHRESGTIEELRAADLLRKRFDTLGYATEIQRFAVGSFGWPGWESAAIGLAQLAVTFPVKASIHGLLLNSEPGELASLETLQLVDWRNGSTLEDGKLNGQIAFINAGDIHPDDRAAMLDLQAKLDRVATAGAAAAVISAPNSDHYNYRLFLAVSSSIPALMVDLDSGRVLEEYLKQEEVVVSVEVAARVLVSQNVVAELRGTGDEVVVVGAHYDTTPESGAGANDNASGTAVALALADALAGQSLPFTVRFVSFGAEELGLHGSTYYVASLSDVELGRVKAMLNFDVVGSGEYLAVSGQQGLTARALNLAGELEVQAQAGSLPPGASSDHAPFEIAGVPVLLFWAPDISRIHSPADRLEFIQSERLGEAMLVAESLLQSPEFPP